MMNRCCQIRYGWCWALKIQLPSVCVEFEAVVLPNGSRRMDRGFHLGTSSLTHIIMWSAGSFSNFLEVSWSLDQNEGDDEDRSLADGFCHSLRYVCRTDLGWFGFAGFQEWVNWQPLCSARLECLRYISMQLDKHRVHQARLRERDQFGVSVSEWEAFGKFREAAVVAGASSF